MFSANENLALRQHKRRVVAYVEDTIPASVLDQGVNVMVMQVQCKARGCVPLETCVVIVFPKVSSSSSSSNTNTNTNNTIQDELLPGLSESAGGSFTTKVLKPMADVTRDDVLNVLPGPAFIGGRRPTLAQVARELRDDLLGRQFTQRLDFCTTAGRTLVAQYLQRCLQEYVDNDCELPEYNDDEPDETNSVHFFNETPIGVVDSATTTISTTTQEKDEYLYSGTGNVVIRRPMDDDIAAATTVSNVAQGTVSSDTRNSSLSATAATPLCDRPPHPTLAATPSSFSVPAASKNDDKSSSASVLSMVHKRNQQRAASKLISSSASSNSSSSARLLAQLSQREHAPGIRRVGCPCCDPDNLSTVVDALLSQI